LLIKMYNQSMVKKGFTLMEILIVISIVIILAVVALIVLNPLGQINKANDSKRKSELATLSKVLEDWYNDKNCYPKPSEICYDTPVNNTCHVCGNISLSPNFTPYLSSLPCDPQYPTKKFLYQYDNSDCPLTYWIYTELSNKQDPVITELGCQNGCGPYGGCDYNYGVTSPNAKPEYCTAAPTSTPSPTPTPIIAGPCSSFNPIYIISNNICNVCGSYPECKATYPNKDFYSDDLCTRMCIKD